MILMKQKTTTEFCFVLVFAVQTRELTQLQTILQNQIERFGNEILVDGTIVTGSA